jgi:glycosyltransferase involved in cell wall biosynthesis
MNNPLVSIIIPVYNAATYLQTTIQCAIDQTWTNKEIIIIDDGSTDNSLAVAKQYENHPSVRVFSQENKGSGATRNKGIVEAKGDYIQFLDADDIISTNKIESQLKLLIPNAGKIAICSTVHFFEKENPYTLTPSAYEDSFLYETNNPVEFLINLYGGNNNRASMIQTNTWLVPADIIHKAGNWSEFYSPDDDGEFFCRVVLASSGIVYAPKCFNYYRKYNVNNNLASMKTKVAIAGKFKSFLLKRQYLLNASDSSITKKAIANTAMGLAVESYLIDNNITSDLLQIVKESGGTDYIPVMGGKFIEFIKKTFGWKTTKKLQAIVR